MEIIKLSKTNMEKDNKTVYNNIFCNPTNFMYELQVQQNSPGKLLNIFKTSIHINIVKDILKL